MAAFLNMRLDTAKLNFFDSAKIISATSRAERRVLSRFGAFVRQAARRSIRKRKRVSNPGDPPSSHKGQLRRFIFFFYDPARQSVVVGPILLGTKKRSVPLLLEEGGTVFRRIGGRRQTFKYSRRPFMGPALAKESPKLPGLWANSVR